MPRTFAFDNNWPATDAEVINQLRQISGLAFNHQGQLLALTRGDNDWIPQQGFAQRRISSAAVLVIDPETGHVLNRWGADLFVLPHQITTDKQGNIWITDCGARKLFKFDSEGELRLEIGGDQLDLKLSAKIVAMRDVIVNSFRIAFKSLSDFLRGEILWAN